MTAGAMRRRAKWRDETQIFLVRRSQGTRHATHGPLAPKARVIFARDLDWVGMDGKRVNKVTEIESLALSPNDAAR